MRQMPVRLLLLALALVSASCRVDQPAPARVRLRVSGAPLAAALKAALATTHPEVQIEAVQGKPGLSPVEQVERGDADITQQFADNVYAAYVAASGDSGGAGSPLRAITVLQPAALLLVARPEAGIRSVTDVRGHLARMNSEVPNLPFRKSWTVPLGLSEHGGGELIKVTALSHLMLAAFGVNPDSIRNRPMPPSDAFRALGQGKLDAVFTTVLGSGDAISELTARGMRLIPIEGPAVDRLRRQYAFIKPVSVPAGTYAGQTTALHTVGVDLVVVCRASLDEQLVYAVTKAYFDAASQLEQIAPGQEPVDPERAPSTPIPLHEGAARYFRERELFR